MSRFLFKGTCHPLSRTVYDFPAKAKLSSSFTEASLPLFKGFSSFSCQCSTIRAFKKILLPRLVVHFLLGTLGDDRIIDRIKNTPAHDFTGDPFAAQGHSLLKVALFDAPADDIKVGKSSCNSEPYSDLKTSKMRRKNLFLQRNGPGLFKVPQGFLKFLRQRCNFPSPADSDGIGKVTHGL